VLRVVERNYRQSEELLKEFQITEKVFGCEWDDAEDENANYIWVVDIVESERPIGFLAYKLLYLREKTEFTYILKLFVLNEYRGENPILMEDERISKVLFNTVVRKGYKIVTLEPSCERLEEHYQEEFGFKYIETISKIFANVIDATKYRKILYWLEHDEVENDLTSLYGVH